VADEELTTLIRLEADLSGGREAIREVENLDAATKRANASQESGSSRAKSASDRATSSVRSHSSAVSGLEANYKKFSNSVGGASSSVNGFLANIGKRTVQASALGFGALLGWVIKSQSSIEQIRISLDTFTNQTMGKQLMDQIHQIDIASPFTFPEIADSTKQLIAFGVEAEKATGLESALTAIASGSGKGAAGLQQLSLAVAQVKSSGRLQGDEARQLSEFFNVYELAGQKYGKTAVEVKKAIEGGAAVPADVILDSIAKLEGPLAMFQGLNEKQLNTMQGRWSSFKSNMQILVAGNGEEDQGIFGPLKNELKNEIPIASQDLGDALTTIAPSLNKAAIAGMRFAEALIPIATPIVSQVFQSIANGLTKATPLLERWGNNPQLNPRVKELGNTFDQMVPGLIDLAIAMGPVVRDMTTLANHVLPFIYGPLSAVVHGLADLTSQSRAASFAIGSAVTAFLTWRLIAPVIGTIRSATTAVLALNAASASDLGNTAGRKAIGKGAAGLLGLGGLGLLGIYEGAKADKGSGGQALGLIGGGAATGAVVGSVVPGFGTVIGGTAGALGGAAAYGFEKFLGDVPGQFASTLSSHSSVEAATPGSRSITSGVRNWGLASSRSGHANGTAVDVHGPWMASYQQNVRAAGGWAKQHDAGSGQHVHAAYGDTPGMASGGTWQGDGGGPNIVMHNYISQPMDITKAVRQGIIEAQREREKRR
jgi:tape measure domain-containing protein